MLSKLGSEPATLEMRCRKIYLIKPDCDFKNVRLSLICKLLLKCLLVNDLICMFDDVVSSRGD